jgi:hypothetical protein
MSTITVADIPLDQTSPAQRLRRLAAGVRVQFTWWGAHRSLTAQQKEEAGLTYHADARLITAGKKLLDTRHEALRRLTSIRTRVVNYWRGLTLPYTEPGLRLIRQADVEAFVHTLEGFRDDLLQAEGQLNTAFEAIKGDARRRLGRLFNPGDYPSEVRGLFNVSWDFPSVQPPDYLLRIAPEVYQEEQERVARRFEEAVVLAEQAFVSEFAKLVSHLTERRIFRDSAVTNLLDFFERFRTLGVRSNRELDALVDQAQGLVRGVTPQSLRGDGELRQHMATEMGRLQTQLEGLLVNRPRRQLIRAQLSRNGGGHAAGG